MGEVVGETVGGERMAGDACAALKAFSECDWYLFSTLAFSSSSSSRCAAASYFDSSAAMRSLVSPPHVRQNLRPCWPTVHITCG